MSAPIAEFVGGAEAVSGSWPMLAYIAMRLGQGVLLLLVMSLLVFVAVYAIGNPITMLINPSSPPEVIEETIRRLGLDQPCMCSTGASSRRRCRAISASPTSRASRRSA